MLERKLRTQRLGTKEDAQNLLHQLLPLRELNLRQSENWTVVLLPHATDVPGHSEKVGRAGGFRGVRYSGKQT